MSAVAAVATQDEETTNVVSVEFRNTSPVVVDYAEASTPKSEIAQRLAAEAAETAAKLASRDKKVGALRVLASSTSDLSMLNPYLLKIKEGWNSRVATDPDNIEHVDMLARSIAEIGVQQPLTVVHEGDNTYVTDGHCRLLAVFRAIEVYGAEIKSVPVRAEGRFATEADRVLSQIVRNSGKPLTVLEQGKVFVRLVQFGWTEKQISDKAGMNIQRVREILSFMDTENENIQTLVAAGKVSATTAQAVLRDADGDSKVAEKALVGAVEIAESVGKKKATMKHVRAAEAGAKAPKLSTRAMLREIFEANTTQIEEAGRRASIHMSMSNWKKLQEILGI